MSQSKRQYSPDQQAARNKREKERRLKLLADGICPRCRKNPVATGHTACQPCLDYNKNKERTQQQKAAQRECQATKRLAAKNKGFCVTCCKRPAALNENKCLECIQAKKEARINRRERVYTAYGNKCSCPCGCNISTWQFLTLDHINNDGAAHRKEIGRRELIDWAEKNGYPPRLRLLCSNCNTGRERNGGVCPLIK